MYSCILDMVTVLEIVNIFCRLRCQSFPVLSIGKESCFLPTSVHSLISPPFTVCPPPLLGLALDLAEQTAVCSARSSAKPKRGVYPQCRREEYILREEYIPNAGENLKHWLLENYCIESDLCQCKQVQKSSHMCKLLMCTPSVATGQIWSIQFMHATKYWFPFVCLWSLWKSC